ncbi:TetR family transcriptional regulator [Nocardioides sp. SYSU D00038]|uniref:TetR/AcrR family transcriptional regulator n=1 Tax=Nocardioides sp. SYSU D00038 TaxID=2812554 RepID=UPI001968571D|nr:TetR family transcriptional regulator [Nocardioides sp. SYSU D00038]
MSESAATGLVARQAETRRRIRWSAAELTRERGFEGWTMDDLAAAVGVSRRTLFNYFEAKVDAVLGPVPVFPETALATFLAGGPTGVLVDDLRELAKSILEDDDLDRRVVEVRREVFLGNPRLLVTVHERFEQVTGDLVDHILAREGAEFGVHRARLLVRLLVALFDGCLVHLSETPTEDRPVVELFDAALAEARRLLA